ncbi:MULTISPECIES: hypothetical protein [unclassified Acidovorax]|uniref:hypothetical protein n=1 Tax=unclassified Acidovorax TaxID=2684926 RepID=UPI001C48BE3E|nr:MULTISPECIES: hypothetical protein [unclassified Acidovorax]MBV7431699.1 hypothetical protein [Acidovorax sp. sif0732]MBV7452823.1 hypothetical protein [Acidovorax sp. sif0715]
MKKKFISNDFAGLVKIYFCISLFLGIVLPVDVGAFLPKVMIFVDGVVGFLPGIRNIAQYSKFEGYIKLYYVIQWFLFPVLCCFLFFAVKKTKVKNQKRRHIPFSIYFFTILFALLSGLMIYMMGFFYRDDVGGDEGGRVGALIWMLAGKYTVGVAAPIVFFAMSMIFIVPVLIVDELIIRWIKGDDK